MVFMSSICSISWILPERHLFLPIWDHCRQLVHSQNEKQSNFQIKYSFINRLLSIINISLLNRQNFVF